eukprot:14175762-Alexandrium_andersonii.AAC.1
MSPPPAPGHARRSRELDQPSARSRADRPGPHWGSLFARNVASNRARRSSEWRAPAAGRELRTRGRLR